jgi:hypothetical protein
LSYLDSRNKVESTPINSSTKKLFQIFEEKLACTLILPLFSLLIFCSLDDLNSVKGLGPKHNLPTYHLLISSRMPKAFLDTMKIQRKSHLCFPSRNMESTVNKHLHYRGIIVTPELSMEKLLRKAEFLPKKVPDFITIILSFHFE